MTRDSQSKSVSLGIEIYYRNTPSASLLPFLLAVVAAGTNMYKTKDYLFLRPTTEMDEESEQVRGPPTSSFVDAFAQWP